MIAIPPTAQTYPPWVPRVAFVLEKKSGGTFRRLLEKHHYCRIYSLNTELKHYGNCIEVLIRGVFLFEIID
jgi:hypothetical protein